MTAAAVIVAAGASSRMGGGIKKEYRRLPGAFDSEGAPVTVLGAIVETFLAFQPEIAPIIVAHPLNAHNGETGARAAIGSRLACAGQGRLFFVPGGATRQKSVWRALRLLSSWQPDIVLVHDGARPWLNAALIEKVLNAVKLHGAALPVLPLTETPKTISGSFVSEHLKRESVVLAQTPQGFFFNALLSAHEKAAMQNEAETGRCREWTDDAEIYGAFSGQVACVEGDFMNRKITFANDLPSAP
jgi:2-C-methyl-D-erythritol 4-phosphate cytidylyltransferase